MFELFLSGTFIRIVFARLIYIDMYIYIISFCLILPGNWLYHLSYSVKLTLAVLIGYSDETQLISVGQMPRYHCASRHKQ